MQMGMYVFMFTMRIYVLLRAWQSSFASDQYYSGCDDTCNQVTFPWSSMISETINVVET